MKKRLRRFALVLAVALLAALFAWRVEAQFTSTPNLNLQIPNIGDTANWGTYLNNDLTTLDSLLGCFGVASATCTAPGPIVGSLSITSPSLVGTTSVKSSDFLTSSVNPAASGIVRLATGDSVCWRNFANTADVCLSKNSSDQIVIPGGGVTTSGPWVPGDLIKQDTTTGNIVDAGIVAASVPTFTGTPTATHLATWSSSGVLQDGGTIPTGTIAIQSNCYSTLSADISLTVSTITNVVTCNVTMPSTGCPCRASIHYNLMWSSNNQTWDTGVFDGTNYYATAQATGAGTNVGGMRGSEITHVTYANSAAVTFSLQVEINGVGGTVKAAPAMFGQNTYLNVAVLTSN